MLFYSCAELCVWGLGGTNLNEIVTVTGLASILMVFRAHRMKVERALLAAWSRVCENMMVAELNFRLSWNRKFSYRVHRIAS
jgi:hypothetical protein